MAISGESEASKASSVRRRAHRTCKCGVEAKLRTSWTKESPGRHFFECYKGKDGCNYFSWYDGEMGEREQKMISTLIRKLDIMEDRLKLCTRALIVSVIVIFLLLLVLLKVVG